jgi:hypothetical protein
MIFMRDELGLDAPASSPFSFFFVRPVLFLTGNMSLSFVTTSKATFFHLGLAFPLLGGLLFKVIFLRFIFNEGRCLFLLLLIPQFIENFLHSRIHLMISLG